MNEIQIQAHLATQHALNKALLDAIVAHGTSLDTPHPTDHFFNLKRKSDAESLGKKLTLLGFEKISLTSAGWFVFSKYSIHAVLKVSPHEVTADAFVEKLVRLAAEHNAVYDGWGMQLGNPSA